MAASSSLQRLLHLLEKPNSLDIAERMIINWTSNKSIEKKSIHNTSCMCSLLRKSEWTCDCFHWRCIFNYLTSKTTQIQNDTIIVCTQFAKLTELVKIQFLTLLINIHSIISTQILSEFIDSTTEAKLDTWSSYLIRKLATVINHHTHTTLSSKTITNISKICVGENQLISTQPSTQSDRKRSISHIIIEDSPPTVKHIKLSTLPPKKDLSLKEEAVCTNQEIHHLPDNIQLIFDSILNCWRKGEKAPTDKFSLLITLPPNQFDKCLLQLESNDEPSTLGAINNMTEDIDMNYKYQVSCIRHFITPYFIVLQKPVLRPLMSSLLKVINKYPQSSIDGLLYPLVLLNSSFSSTIDSSHSGLVCKLLQQITDDQRSYLWNKMASTKEKINGELYIWNDHLIKVFQNIIDKGVSLNCPSIVVSFVKLLQINAGHHTKSLSFASLLVTLLTKHCTELKNQKSVIINIIEGNKTALKNKLTKLRDNL